MITLGDQKEIHWPDGWTAVTKGSKSFDRTRCDLGYSTVYLTDGKHSAQFEETLLITETGVEILTGPLPPKENGDVAPVSTNGETVAVDGSEATE
jgi:methionyl aminopeptidase